MGGLRCIPFSVTETIIANCQGRIDYAEQEIGGRKPHSFPEKAISDCYSRFVFDFTTHNNNSPLPSFDCC